MVPRLLAVHYKPQKSEITDEVTSHRLKWCLETVFGDLAHESASVRQVSTVPRRVHSHVLRIPVDAERSSRLRSCRQSPHQTTIQSYKTSPFGILWSRPKDEGVEKSGNRQDASRAGSWILTDRMDHADGIRAQERRNTLVLCRFPEAKRCSKAWLLHYPTDGKGNQFSL